MGGMEDPRQRELLRQGKVDEALALASQRLKEARKAADDATLAEALLDEARAEWAHGDRDDAVMTVDEAISKARRGFGPKDPRYAEALEVGAEIAAEAGMPNAADARFRSAIDILEGAGIRGDQLLHALYHHGLFRRAQGDVDGAVRALVAVLDPEHGREGRGSARYVAMALTALGSLSLEAGAVAEARALGDRALELWVEVGQARRFEVADGMTVVGVAALRQGDAETAAEFLATACEIYAKCKVDVHPRHAEAATAYARALEALGRPDDARRGFERALDLYREGDPARLTLEQRILELSR